MWLLRIIGLVLVGGAAFLASSQAEGPASTANPPKRQDAESEQRDPRSFLDGQSESDRRRLLDRQQRTFQLEMDGRYAKALKAYCDTGFGDERCFRPELPKPYQAVVPLPVPTPGAAALPVLPPSAPPKGHAGSSESQELPAVAQISGFGEELTAILVFPGGKRMRVFGPGADGSRSQLPDGEAVISIRPGEVLVSRPGESRPVPLLFQAAVPPGGLN